MSHGATVTVHWTETLPTPVAPLYLLLPHSHTACGPEELPASLPPPPQDPGTPAGLQHFLTATGSLMGAGGVTGGPVRLAGLAAQ